LFDIKVSEKSYNHLETADLYAIHQSVVK